MEFESVFDKLASIVATGKLSSEREKKELRRVVHEAKMKYETLAEQVEYLQLVLDTDPNFIFARDRSGMFKLANKALAQSYNLSPEELIGMTDADFISDKRQVKLILSDDQYVMDSREDALTPAKRIVDEEGNEKWLRIIKRPIVKSDDTVEEVLAIAVDITDLKQAEKELMVKERRYRALVRANANLIWVTNKDGLVDEEIKDWREYTGQQYEDIMGEGWIKAIHVDERERVKRLWFRAVATETHFEVTCRVRAHDFSYTYFHMHGVPVYNDDGKLVEWVGSGLSEKGRNFIAH